jgi:hypothetical protein
VLEESDLQFTLLPPSDVLLTDELADTLRISDAGTDLRIDWADAASLGFDGEQYFLIIVDKGTEHVVTYNTKTRSDPVDLLADYITITKRVPKVLRVDGAKEFVGAKMKAFCYVHNITLQIVTSYSHTMQARVEGAIGIIKQHSGIALSTANVPTRFWPYATKDFVYKRNFLSHSALVLSPDSQNYTARLLAKVLAILMLKASIYVPMIKRQLFICTI